MDIDIGAGLKALLIIAIIFASGCGVGSYYVGKYMGKNEAKTPKTIKIIKYYENGRTDTISQTK